MKKYRYLWWFSANNYTEITAKKAAEWRRKGFPERVQRVEISAPMPRRPPPDPDTEK